MSQQVKNPAAFMSIALSVRPLWTSESLKSGLEDILWLLIPTETAQEASIHQ